MGSDERTSQRIQIKGLKFLVFFFFLFIIQFVCLICDKRKRALVVLPCSHFVLCGECYTEGNLFCFFFVFFSFFCFLF
jgi:hypothetical protein